MERTEPVQLGPDCLFCDVTQLKTSEINCGIHQKKFEFLSKFGRGYLEYYGFDGLMVFVIDSRLHQDIQSHGKYNFNMLELSYLIEGEHFFKIDNSPIDLIYESQESYLVYLPKVSGTIYYSKDKPLKEVKIRMTSEFIDKHQLDKAYMVSEKFGLHNIENNFAKPHCQKTHDILAEILSDNRNGLMKRLFLESKVLELLSLQMSSKPSTQKESLVKKLYQIKSIVSADLTQQHTISQLARTVGLNEFIIKKGFKRVFGQTIAEYIMSLKMTKARNLLRLSDKTISEISEIVGYKNATHFTAAFKKTEGITPKSFRKNI